LKTVANVLFVISCITYLFGQGNGIQKENSVKEQMELYKRNLKQDIVREDAIEIKLIKRIPSDTEIDEKEIYFRNLLYIYVDGRGHIYAPDPSLCIIYEFNENGKYIRRYENRGQGPGELQHPQRIYFVDDKIIVMDPMLGRLTYYDREWIFKKSVSLFGRYCIGIDKDSRIYCMNFRGEYIITVLDANGKIIKEYGVPLYPNKPQSILNKFFARVTPNGNVWIGYEALGIIRKYSKEGELEKEININEYYNEHMKKLIENNKKNDANDKMKYSPIIKGIAFNGEEAIVTCGGIVNQMFRINNDGDVIKAYYISPQFRTHYTCSEIRSVNNGEEIFYILENIDGERSIGIYGQGQ